MKLALILLVGLLAACNNNESAKDSGSTKVVTEADNGREIHLAVGEQLVVKLGSNVTTGYSWNDRSNGELVIQQQGTSTYVAKAHAPGVVGSGGIETWKYKAVKSGKQTLRLDYNRPWEKEAAPAQTVSFSVVVK